MAAVAIGYVWARSGHVLDPRSLTPLISEVSVPCLAFATLATLDAPLAELGRTALAAIAVIVSAGLVAYVGLRVFGLKTRTYLPAMTFPNAGNLGLSLSLSAFGQTGLTYGMIFFAIMSVANNTAGRAIASGESNLRGLLRAPILPAIVFGLAFQIFHVRPPEFLVGATRLIGQIGIPLMLLMLGASLATIRLERFSRPLILSVARLLGGAAIGFAVAALFGLTGAQRAVLVLQSAMPAAVINYMFAQLFDNEPAEIAGVVVISTLLSAITTPVLLAILIAP